MVELQTAWEWTRCFILPLFPNLKKWDRERPPLALLWNETDTESGGRMLDSWSRSLSPLASLRHFLCSDLPSCRWHLSSSSAFSALCSPTFPKEGGVFFRPCSVEDFLLQDDVAAFPLQCGERFLIKTKPPWDPGKGHVELPRVEPAPQRDRPPGRTFELKRTFLFITASSPHNKGEVERLAPEPKEHHTLHILLHCNPRTENYSSKKAFMAISREMPCN